MSLFDELKRRKVFKVGAAYLVVAWLAVQAASIGFPAFDAPPWALRIFILIALLGFPIAVVMAWVFDITPEGVKLDADTSGSKRLVRRGCVAHRAGTGLVFLRPTVISQRRRGHAGHRRSEFDRRPAVRQHERQIRRGLFLRRHDRRALKRARQSAATQGRGPHLGVSVQRQRRRHPRDRPQARRHEHRRGQRASRWRGRADHGAVGARRRWFSHLVGDLRS